MATHSRIRDDEDWTDHLVRLKTFRRSKELITRMRERPEFQRYVTSRLWLVIPMLVIAVIISIVCTAAVFVFMGRIHSWLILPAIFAAPVVLIGSAFVQVYVLLHWIEGRALMQTIRLRARPATRVPTGRNKRKAAIEMGPLPPVPWILAAVLLLGPIAMLAQYAWPIAVLILLLIVLLPAVYAYIDR
jgi:hypothetical protein